MRDNHHCSRRLVVALDIDLVWTRDGLIAEPFSQSRLRGETARGGVVDDECRMCRRRAGRLARRRAIGIRRAAIDDKPVRANGKLKRRTSGMRAMGINWWRRTSCIDQDNGVACREALVTRVPRTGERLRP